jgi:hypothetical protein
VCALCIANVGAEGWKYKEKERLAKEAEVYALTSVPESASFSVLLLEPDEKARARVQQLSLPITLDFSDENISQLQTWLNLWEQTAQRSNDLRTLGRELVGRFASSQPAD